MSATMNVIARPSSVVCTVSPLEPFRQNQNPLQYGLSTSCLSCKTAVSIPSLQGHAKRADAT
jgi:hypothetical protein